jgi:hypothetical protein
MAEFPAKELKNRYQKLFLGREKYVAGKWPI